MSDEEIRYMRLIEQVEGLQQAAENHVSALFALAGNAANTDRNSALMWIWLIQHEYKITCQTISTAAVNVYLLKQINPQVQVPGGFDPMAKVASVNRTILEVDKVCQTARNRIASASSSECSAIVKETGDFCQSLMRSSGLAS